MQHYKLLRLFVQSIISLTQVPQPPTGAQDEADNEASKEYRQLMAQYWAEWSSNSNNEPTSEEGQQNAIGTTAGNQPQSEILATNTPPLPKGPAPS